MSEADKLAPYKAHGVHLRTHGSEAKGDCPFCGKEGHFFVSTKTGQYECKVGCSGEDSRGNIYTFLAKIHADSLKKTKKADWERLSSIRGGAPWQIFRDGDLAWHKPTSRWLIPINNLKGSLSNLGIYDPKMKPKPQIRGTDTCAQHLFLGDQIKPTGPIYVCEGHWDALYLRWLMSKNNIDPSITSVVACPGANTFKKEWVEPFKGREVYLLFDHDTAGESGMDRIGVMLAKPAKFVRRIHWPSDLPAGYDIGNYVLHNAEKPKDGWKKLQALLPEKITTPGKAKPKLVRATFQSVLKDFQRKINGKRIFHTDKAWEEALAICMAVVASRHLKNDPLWMFLVGPPGAGKTLLVESFLNLSSDTPGAGTNHVEYMSKITRPALVSGFRGEEDFSLLPNLNERCLIVKDYTAIVSLPLQVQEELYGILRDAYDGHVTVPFGNMEPKRYDDLYFSMIASVTDVIRTHNRAALGERFLKLELLDEAHDPKIHIRTALSAIEDNIAEKAEAEEFLRSSVAAFMERPFDEGRLPRIPSWLIDRLVHLAQLGSNLRAVVAKQGGELSYRPRPEVGTRFAKTLAKLARCLCWVYDKKKIDEQVYTLVQRVALDTVLGWDLEILHALFSAGKSGAAISDLGEMMQLSHSGINRRLEDLQHLSIVHRSAEIKKDGRGRKQFLWYMSDEIRELWAGAKMQYAPPPVVRFKKRNGYTPKNSNRVSRAKALRRVLPSDRTLKPTKVRSKTPTVRLAKSRSFSTRSSSGTNRKVVRRAG